MDGVIMACKASPFLSFVVLTSSAIWPTSTDQKCSPLTKVIMW
jgi:hypothetical protein